MNRAIAAMAATVAAAMITAPAALGAPTETGAAKPKTVKTKVDLNPGYELNADFFTLEFTGRLKSKSAKCVKKRDVLLSTKDLSGNAVPLGSATTNKRGEFTIGTDPLAIAASDGSATATVVTIRLGGKHPVKCGAGSDTETQEP